MVTAASSSPGASAAASPDKGEKAPLLSSNSEDAPWWRLGSETVEPVRDTTFTASSSSRRDHHGEKKSHERNRSDWTCLSSRWGSTNNLEEYKQPKHWAGSTSAYSATGEALWPPHYPRKMKLVLFLSYLAVLTYVITICVGPLLLLLQDKAVWCPYEYDEEDSFTNNNNERRLKSFSSRDHAVESSPLLDKDYENPDYITDPCRYVRLPRLLFLTLEDCDVSRRMLVSVLLGGAIGYERRSSDRPAGIRTMGLVSLGACFFTISSIMAFKSSTMGWDASRVTAALPSGVGFLGGALIWKGTVSVNESTEQHQVHGLTTAASLWLSAAIGVGAGGALYFVTLYSTVLVVLVLRYGPRLYLRRDTEYDDDDDDDDKRGVEYDNDIPKNVGQEQESATESAGLPVSRQTTRSASERPLKRQSKGPTYHS